METNQPPYSICISKPRIGEDEEQTKISVVNVQELYEITKTPYCLFVILVSHTSSAYNYLNQASSIIHSAKTSNGHVHFVIYRILAISPLMTTTKVSALEKTTTWIQQMIYFL